MFEIIVRSDRAEADSFASALVAAQTLAVERADACGIPLRMVRKEIIITLDGIYHGGATHMAREGRWSV